MLLHPTRRLRINALLGLGLALGLIVSSLRTANGQSIVAGEDIVGNDISWQALIDSQCQHLGTYHAVSTPPFCNQTAAIDQSIVTDADIVGGGIGLQNLTDSHCEHLSFHSVVPLPAYCDMAAASGHSIVSELGIVGNGISFQDLEDSQCGHLANEHPGISDVPAFCNLGVGERFVFATSGNSGLAGGNLLQWANNLGLGTFGDGLAASDAICQKYADDVGLPGVYKAWLSTAAVDAKDRIRDFRWVREDLSEVANDKQQLLSCTRGGPVCLDEPILNEFGIENAHKHWTGTYEDGTNDLGGSEAITHCNDWTSNSSGDDGRRGVTGTRLWEWTSFNEASCNTAQGLLCFQN